jgi:hypothetical protein
MRTLFEIVAGAKHGNRPTHDECHFAMLALANLLAMDHRDLRETCTDPKRSQSALWRLLAADGSARRYQAALDADPQRWLGDDVPGNPEHDWFRAAGKRPLDRLEEQGPRGG